MCTKLGSTKIIFIDRCALIFREPLCKKKGKRTRNRKIWIQSIEHNIIILSLSDYYTLSFLLDLQSTIQTKKWQLPWKKNWTPSLKSTEESTVNQNSFRVLSILYTTNFCETRRINSNAIRVLFLLLNFRKSRKCALN